MMKFSFVSFVIILFFTANATAKASCYSLQRACDFSLPKSLKLLFQKKVFFVHDFNFTKNVMFVGDADSKMLCPVNTFKKPCPTTPYVNVTLLKDITRPYLQVIGRDVKTDLVILEQTLNICHIVASPGLDILLKLLLDYVKENVNFQIKCPFNKVNQRSRSETLNHQFPLPGLLLTEKLPERKRSFAESLSGESNSEIYSECEVPRGKNYCQHLLLRDKLRGGRC